MVVLATLLFIHGAGLVGSMPSMGTPENITVMFLSPTSVKVSWTTSIDLVEKYDVTYKPTDASYRVVAVVAGNSDSVTLSSLLADTQYQVTVTAVRAGKKFRSRPIVFRTLEAVRGPEVIITGGPPPEAVRGPEVLITGGPPGKSLVMAGNGRPNIPSPPNISPTYIQVRGVEVGIVLLVLVVWIGAIILFFNRWGKIRMLLPYQPDYKDTQLKVPGTGACAGTTTCQNQSGTGFCCSQRHLHRGLTEDFDWRSRSAFIMPHRSRINSAIYISSQHRSECEPLFCSENFKTIRKAKSADQLTVPKSPKHEHDSSDNDLPNNLELPILSVSVASDKPFVEQYL
ncbi:uncharacterized protein LOC142333674 isoform X2 [Lycorma delicatula]|uniref:uncharacterized protein LOC142333674 isoform X2 n=1 Tax=Lycorma delicatula TaxID=130591 RepID=UPI003F51A2D7